MTDNELATVARAIAKADGWNEREITSRAMGPLEWQTYEEFARAAIEAIEKLKAPQP